MNIVWLSSNKFGYELIKEAKKIHDITYIITLKEDSKTIMYDKVEKWDDLGIPVYEINNINEEKKLLEHIKPHIIIVAGWRQIIDQSIINKYSFIGFHPTLLPKGRGNAPIIYNILNDLKESGVTMFYVGEGVDNGDIIGQEKFKIEKNDYAIDLYNKSIQAGIKLVKKYLPEIIKGTNPRNEQNEQIATYNEKLSLSNNEIDLSDNLEDIYRKIRALSYPYRGAYIKKDGKKLIIWKADLVNDQEN
jgi:methionyl-tRNA formyltransferase